MFEGIAFKIKFNSESSGKVALLPNSQVLGEYLDNSNGRALMSVTEKDRALFVRLQNGMDLRLDPVSGNRYKMPGGGFVTFIKDEGGAKAMLELPTGQTVIANRR